MKKKKKTGNPYPWKKVTGEDFKTCLLCGDICLYYWESELTGAVLCEDDYEKNISRKKTS